MSSTVGTYSGDQAPIRSPTTAYVGQELGGTYRVGRLIALGGMSAVHEATHMRLGHRVAVKFLDRQYRNYQEAFARFKREAEIASSLGHDNIAKVTDFNTLPDGTPYMIMELLDGEDLGARLARGSLPIEHVVTVSEQLASGLGAAHRSCIVHRDLKPDNIFLCPNEHGSFTVKVLDFGISKIRGAMKSLTSDAQLMGTPAYMSPEQARGDRAKIDERSDIYSVGALLYETLCGRPPYQGENVYEILTQVATTEPPALPGFPEEVNAVLQRAMARDPADRFATVGELHRALVFALTGRTIRASSAAESFRWESIGPALAETEEVHAVDEPPPDRPRRWLAIVAAGIGAAALIGTVAFLAVAGDAPAPAPATMAAIPAPRPPAPAAAVTPPTPVAPDLVTLTIAALPPIAHVAIGGKPVTGSVQVTRSTQHVAVDASAPGYRDRQIEVVADHDQIVEVRLEPVQRPQPRPVPKPKAKVGLVTGSEL